MEADGKPTAEDLKLLAALNQGIDFSVVTPLVGLPAAFHCILNGWIDRGQLTEAGRAILPENLRGRKSEIRSSAMAKRETDKFTVTDLTTGKVLSAKDEES